VEKRRSAQNVEILRKAEANLDRFWLRADRELLDKNGIPQREHLLQILPHGELRRTPKWTEPEKVTHAVGSFLLYLLHFQSLPVLALGCLGGNPLSHSPTEFSRPNAAIYRLLTFS
jgi:hypothetical protein